MSTYYIKFITLILAVSCCLFAPSAFGLSALDPWDAEARRSLGTPVKVWLICMQLNNLASLAFVKKHVAARWVFAGYFLSHALGLVMMLNGFEFIVGQVSILHILFWTPGALALFVYRKEILQGGPYRIWAGLAIMFYIGSMLFDVTDATIYLHYLLS